MNKWSTSFSCWHSCGTEASGQEQSLALQSSSADTELGHNPGQELLRVPLYLKFSLSTQNRIIAQWQLITRHIICNSLQEPSRARTFDRVPSPMLSLFGTLMEIEIYFKENKSSNLLWGIFRSSKVLVIFNLLYPFLSNKPHWTENFWILLMSYGAKSHSDKSLLFVRQKLSQGIGRGVPYEKQVRRKFSDCVHFSLLLCPLQFLAFLCCHQRHKIAAATQRGPK